MKAERKHREERQKDAIKWVGISIREARKVGREAAKVRRDAKCRLYHLHLESKALFVRYGNIKKLLSY